MKKILILIIALFTTALAFAKPGEIPGGEIPTQGVFTIEIGHLPYLKGGYTVHCKLINTDDHRKLYVRILNNGGHGLLDVRNGVTVFYFGIEGGKNTRIEFQDYSQPNFQPIIVKSCRLHTYRTE